MLYFTGHGNQGYAVGSGFTPVPSFDLDFGRSGTRQIRPEHVSALHLPQRKFRFVWIDACGAGRDRSYRYSNLKNDQSWRYVDFTTNQMANAFGIWSADLYDPYRGAAYYMAYNGYGYVNSNYLKMVQLFFQSFSAGAGSVNTLGYVLGTFLLGRAEVKDEFLGAPFVGPAPLSWLTSCPPYFNIRVFSDSYDYYFNLWYEGLKMQDLR